MAPNGEAFETVRQAMPGPAKDLAAEEMRRIMTEWHGGHSTGQAANQRRMLNGEPDVVVFVKRSCEIFKGWGFFAECNSIPSHSPRKSCPQRFCMFLPKRCLWKTKRMSFAKVAAKGIFRGPTGRTNKITPKKI